MRVQITDVLWMLAVFAVFSSVAMAGETPQEPSAREANQEPVSKPEKEGEEPIRLGEITVVGKRPKPYYFQDVLEAAEVERQKMSSTVEGLLEGLAGVDLNRRTFAGNESRRLSIRGFDESRSRVLRNGRPLHGAGVYGGYYIDWNSLSLEDVERVEVIRGMAPAKYGNTLGGVVNIVTKKGSEVPRTTLRLGTGAIRHVDGLGMWDTQLSHSWGYGPLLWNISAGHYGTDGYLRNAFVDRDTFGGSLTFKLPADLELTFSGRYTKTKAGMIVYNMPDSPYYESDYPDALGGQLGGPELPFRNHGPGQWGPLDWGDGSYWRDERLNLDVGLSRRTEAFSFDIGAYYIDQDRSEHFMAVTDDDHLVMRRDSEPEKDNWGWRADLKNEFDLLGHHTLEYGAQGSYLGLGDVDVKYFDPGFFRGVGDHPGLLDAEGKDTVIRWQGGYVQDRWQVTPWLDLKPGIRYDSYATESADILSISRPDQLELDETEWSPRFALTLYPWKGGHVTAGYAKAYRFPSIPEYYWWNTGFEPPGRTDLAPEDADQWELEVAHDFSQDLSVTVRAYYYDVQDYVRTIFGYRPSRVVYNIDNVEFKGVELEARYDLPHHFFLWANYTWQDTKKTGDVLDSSSQLSDELVELPEHKLNIGLGYKKAGGLEARLALRFVDERHAIQGDFTTPGGTYLERMDSYVDLDFYASYPVYQGKRGRETRVELTVDNILNDHYEEEYGYPMPGLTVMSGLLMRF